MSIVTCLLHANCKENLTNGGLTYKKKNDFKGRLNLSALPWQRHIRQLNYQKTEVCASNLLVAIFGDQRIKVLEKKVNETQVSKTVFRHLNQSVRRPVSHSVSQSVSQSN